MSDEDHPRSPPGLEADPKDLALAAFNQNFETFRALNALMWQIPLIAMTLTGGLWFGVSKVEAAPGFRLGLLTLSLLGNIGLTIVLERLRFIIGRYLHWLNEAYPRGHVPAVGDSRFTRSETVKRVFQGMLGFAAAISLVLIVATMVKMARTPQAAPPASAAAWYDDHAEQLADGYEGLDAAIVHRELFDLLKGSSPIHILDVGAGTGRDAAALAELGHDVTAVEPSDKMMKLARALHANAKLKWSADSLPRLARQRPPFDLVMLSAVWMHVPPAERQGAFRRLVELSAPNGRIYMSLRIGPSDLRRQMYTVDVAEVRRLAMAEGLVATELADQRDLLGRADVSWKTVIITRPIAP
ncbi:class I SAM-dependent methyltransferase [Sphingomonas sp. TWP1-3-1]|uniref:class I SAM-dependent methyltransferase n=1 Tax=Sphingomonas sp. TWP1-3-1 TaxID=2804612 RepID=UPI003CF5261E